MARMPPPTIPDSLDSVFTAAGIRNGGGRRVTAPMSRHIGPDSLQSVFAAAGIRAAWVDPAADEDPLLPEDGVAAETQPDPVLTDADASDLPPDPALDQTLEEAEPEDEPVRLDTARAAQPSPDPAPAGPVAVRPRGPVASFAVHAVALLAFFDWPAAVPLDPPQPIPVALVMEQAPPDPGQAKAQPPPAPQGNLASDDFGDVTVKKSDAGAPAPAEAPKTEAAPPPPVPQEKPPTPEPKPAKERVAALVPPPKPTPPAQRESKPDATPAAAPPHPAETPHRAPHAARYPGPAATRDEYLAYLLVLTKQHFNLLPRTIVGDRQGETVVTILVLDDGTIARIDVSRSSGYPEIDTRVEQMVAAVGKFPPLPQWYQGPRVELSLRLRFPEALEE